jgi:hypothetical protein
MPWHSSAGLWSGAESTSARIWLNHHRARYARRCLRMLRQSWVVSFISSWLFFILPPILAQGVGQMLGNPKRSFWRCSPGFPSSISSNACAFHAITLSLTPSFPPRLSHTARNTSQAAGRRKSSAGKILPHATLVLVPPLQLAW